MRDRSALCATALFVVAIHVAVVSPAAAAETPAWCGDAHVLMVADLPRELPFSQCSLAGRVISDGPGGIGAVVPPSGYGVAATAGQRTVEIWADDYAVHIGEPANDVMARYGARLADAAAGPDRERLGSSLAAYVDGMVGVVADSSDRTAGLLDDADVVEQWARSDSAATERSATALAHVRAYLAAIAVHGRDDRPDVTSLRDAIVGIAARSGAARDVDAGTAGRELAAFKVLSHYAAALGPARRPGDLPAVAAVVTWYRAAAAGAATVRLTALPAEARTGIVNVANAVAGSSPRGSVAEGYQPSATSPPACADNARSYVFPGSPPTHWATGSAIEWYYNYANQFPRYSATGYSQALSRAFGGITGLSDDCGFGWHPNIYNAFQGFATTLTPNAATGVCAKNGDWYSVIGWSPSMPAPSPGGTATYGYACVFRNTNLSLIIESDVVMSTRTKWDIPELDAAVGYACSQAAEDLDVQGALTHEFGHSVGLDHVDETYHGRLTMSAINDGPCQRSERTLGWGDAIGLSSLYGQV